MNSLKHYIQGEEILHNKKKLVAAIMTFWEEASWYIIALVTGKGKKMDALINFEEVLLYKPDILKNME